ncbi:MAG: DEAD/DEAH box helicase [Clostridia bacterium]
MNYTEQLSKQMRNTLKSMGYDQPTPIQEQTIEPLLAGRDLFGVAQTGTGKTAAFAVPIIEGIFADNRKPQAIVLCPTRELAMQTTEVFRKLSAHLNIRTVSVYGGQPAIIQIKALRAGAQIVVGTPGRVKDLIGRNVLKLKNIRVAVLDEADEMLDFGFCDDIKAILSELPEQHQTLLFSATMNRAVMSIAKQFQNDPMSIEIGKRNEPVKTVNQTVMQITEQQKVKAVCSLLKENDPRLTLIFCNTKIRVRSVTAMLMAQGLEVCCLHGDMRQKERDAIMRTFRNGTAKILVATDVAARGLDVNNIDLVVNYDIPDKTEYYIHRIGRTGRAGHSGNACTFMSPREWKKIKDIERSFNISLKPQILAS